MCGICRAINGAFGNELTEEEYHLKTVFIVRRMFEGKSKNIFIIIFMILVK